MASKKVQRSRSRSRSSKSRSSRSRSRSRSRGRSPARTKTTKTPKPATPNRTTRAKSATPTRMSSRLAAKSKEVEVVEQTSKKVTTANEDEGQKKEVARSDHKEFGGTIGAFFMMLFLPATVYYINMACTKQSCSIRNIPACSGKWSSFFDVEATLIFVGWFFFQAVLYMLPIGRVVQGQPLVIGGHQRLPYRCNGFFAFVVSLLAFAAAVYFKLPVTLVYDKFIQLMTSAILFSTALALFMYVKARMGPTRNLAPGGNTGNFVYDFFMGHELNPRFGSFDFKFFCEMRPGLIGWTMINLVFLVKDFQDGQINYSLAAVAFFQALYVADALWFEDAILSTMDIIYEGFGFMLSFGDLAWVPFLYCLQGRFLLEHQIPMPWYCLAFIVFLNATGYFIFRGSNSQKNDFRNNPDSPALSHLETIPTRNSRKKLLVSGWWGLCRKPNYLGDLIMALAWSLPCGFGYILPYFYPIYFFILLVHRERRDDALCKKKYGASWDRYCNRVKYRIIPGVY
ncbi:hypothetical protein ACF0H5_002476 [Mactra antiquata]